MWNWAILRKIQVAHERIADFTYEEPFESLIGSDKGQIVVLIDRYANRLTLQASAFRVWLNPSP